MTQTTSSPSSRVFNFRSLVGMIVVMLCATVTLHRNTQDNPVTSAFILTLGTIYFLLDLTARGVAMKVTARNGNAEAESANANRRMVAGELRMWLIFFVLFVCVNTALFDLFATDAK